MHYPKMFRVRQHFEGPQLDDVAGAVASELAKLSLGRKVKPGQTVAISAGSRGIANIALVIKAIVEHFKGLGATPFIVPAMGSHGGGTAEGQRAILEGYGITPEYTGAEVRASMETIIVGTTPEGIPVHFDRNASQADHVVVCGRVKPHTGFAGDIESGLMKMMLIGLGKHRGATIYHRAIQNYSFGQIVRSVGQMVLKQCKVVAGVAVVENCYDETALVEAVHPDEFEQREKALLVKAKQWMPRLPFNHVDLLIVDEMGKNISGSGMDTNVIGRKYHSHEAAEHEFPKVTRIFVRGLTRATHGNAAGIGVAEFCTTRLVEQTNWDYTYINCLTGGSPEGAACPLHYGTDREVLEVALPSVGLVEPENARVVHIKNTLDLGEIGLSEAYLAEAQGRDDLTVVDPLREMAFDDEGNLQPVELALATR